MSLFYKFQYLIGLTPWERMPSLPIGDQAAALLDREEHGREPPYGRMLDLGCGTGFWSVRQAQRGWEVTGIDIVPKALRIAGKRARGAGVEIEFVEGSITELAVAGIGSGFRLILDFGVVHGLSPEQVRAVSREVTAVAGEDAALLMYAFSPGRRGPLPRGLRREEIEQAYGGWRITGETAFDSAGAPRFVKKAHLAFTAFAADRRNGATDRDEMPCQRSGVVGRAFSSPHATGLPVLFPWSVAISFTNPGG